jgi:hypothetical protein
MIKVSYISEHTCGQKQSQACVHAECVKSLDSIISGAKQHLPGLKLAAVVVIGRTTPGRDGNNGRATAPRQARAVSRKQS